jgi:hypothetical protein
VSGYRRGAVTVVDTATGLCTVTVDGTDIIAQSLGQLPAVGNQVWIEQRGTRNQDWVITDVHAAPAPAYFEQWDYNGNNVASGADAAQVPANLMFLTGHYPSAWSGTTWTAPVAGPYLWTAVGHPLGGATFRAYVRIQTGGGAILFAIDQATPAVVWSTASGCEWFNVGQTMQVHFFQNTGAGQVQDGVARVAVKLLP